MKTQEIKNTNLTVPSIALGCMRISDVPFSQAEELVQTALEEDINFFDHADIYGPAGKAEEVFSKAIHMNDDIREKIIIQSKCGIRQGRYDFSKEHILSSVDGILSRLKTDYLDLLLLHRPDALVEPEEVAETFNILQESGKVRNFGVSNHNPMQIELLQKYCNQKLVVNQLQFSIAHCNMISNGINVNIANDAAACRDGSILDYCRLKDITIQPWSPFQYGFFEGVYLDNDQYPELNKCIDALAEKYGVTNSAIAIAWILRHPAKMQPVVGTKSPKRLKEICKAADINLTREEWYDVYRAAGNNIP